MSNLGGYKMIDFSDFGEIAVVGGTATLNNVPKDIVEVVKQTEKVVLVHNLTILSDSTVTKYDGFCMSAVTGGVSYQTIGTVAIYSATENQLTIRVS